MKYAVYLGEKVVSETDWPPLAQAAWHRASRDWSAGTHGAQAELWIDGKLLRSVVPRSHGHPWPEGPECDLRDVLKALIQLLRDDEWDTTEIAEAMTTFGLPTSRSRIDALKGGDRARRAEVAPAELVVLINAVLSVYKTRSDGTD